jgi:hypothetical protein
MAGFQAKIPGKIEKKCKRVEVGDKKRGGSGSGAALHHLELKKFS